MALASVLSHCMAQVRRGHEELRKRRLDEFMGGFNTVSLKLKEMYQMITLGGDAELELVDSLDPFSEVCGHVCSCVSTRVADMPRTAAVTGWIHVRLQQMGAARIRPRPSVLAQAPASALVTAPPRQLKLYERW